MSTPSPTSPPVDRSLLRRWLTALGLVSTAEELVRRGDDAANSTALIAADSAAETMLGILGSWTGPPLPPAPKYHEILERARKGIEAAGATLPPALNADLISTHGLRNNVVHHGSSAPALDAQLACRSARSLLDLLPGVATQFLALPAGAGILSGIASLIDAPELTDQLRIGESALATGDASEAGDAAARAHSALLFRLDPPLAGRRAQPSMGPQERQVLGPAGSRIEEQGKNLERVQGWILALAVGMHPTTYQKFQRIVGVHREFLGGGDMVHRFEEPALDEARWALLQVAEMAFRLRELGALVEGDIDEVIKRRQWPLYG